MDRSKSGEKGGFLKGAAWIAFGGFVAKLLGALYRIPLTNLIGGRGLGLYQMVYPVYCLLLTVSATGIPSSIAKLTAERIGKGQGDEPLFRTAMKLFAVVGVCGSVIMVLVAPVLSKAQNATEVLGGYYALAPSVLLVSILSVFRGWFQGRNDMVPTALSEIAEQLVKVAFGLSFAYLFRADTPTAVTFLLLAVSLSEGVALLFVYVLFRRVPAPLKLKKDGDRVAVKTVLALSAPVTFSALLMPASSLLDSVLAVRLLSAYTADAVTLYGLFSGGAVTVMNLPVSVCYGIAAASVPSVATAAATGKGARKKTLQALGLTVLVAAPSALGVYALASPLARVIFRSLGNEELTTLIALIKTISISALTLSCVQTLSACLTARGKPQYAALGMLVGVVVKTVAYSFWLRGARSSVFALAHATNLCYLVAFLFDLVYNLCISTKGAKEK